MNDTVTEGNKPVWLICSAVVVVLPILRGDFEHDVILVQLFVND